jgi:hypothetical protein
MMLFDPLVSQSIKGGNNIAGRRAKKRNKSVF